ncbi:MAG: DNA repair protein RecO [Bacteroidia bacterium]|nr:DNA repair protein RecO [Bacteroidia bacterium]MDW8347054.1 DNA repair protein RecO [Bacteroidia bacterium]
MSYYYNIYTEAIVLRYINYGDNSLIARLYTRENGLISCIAKGVKKKSKKGTSKISYFLPLNICNINLYYSPDKEIHLLSDIHLVYYHQSLHIHFKKIAYTSLLTEFLLGVLHEDNQPYAIFDFLQSKIIQLDQQNEQLLPLYLHILLNTSGYLGYQADEKIWENLLEPKYIHLKSYLHDLYYTSSQNYTLTEDEKKAILSTIEKFMKLHIHGFKGLQSTSIWEVIYSSP